MKKQWRSSRKALATVLLGVLLPFVIGGIAQAAPVLSVSGSVTYSKGSSGVVLAPSLSLTDSNGQNLSGATVTITGAFSSAEDRLGVFSQGGTSGTVSGLSWNYNAATGVLTLSGAAGAATYQEALRQVTYYNTGSTLNTAARTVTFTIGQSTLYSPDTGHYYEFVVASGIRWTDAKTRAEATGSYGTSGYPTGMYGMQGYLVTITSAAENDFAASKLQGQGWIGASDDTVEGQWEWRTGPEAGTQFWSGNYPNGSAVAGRYNNWGSGEPNDWGSGEDYAHFYVGGSWNDYPLQLGNISGYVVEYGGMPGDPTLSLTGSVTVNLVENVNAAPAISMPGAQNANEDTDLAISGVFVTDADAGAANIQVAFTVGNGTLTVNTGISGGVDAGSVVGNGTASVTVTGTLTQINNTLAGTNGLVYRGTLNFNGSDTLTVTANDQGNTGGGGAQTGTGSVNITVNAVNDAPALVANTRLTVDEGSSGAVTAAKLQVTDVDNTPAQITYTIGTAPANGTLYRSTVALAVAGTFTQEDVDGGSISYAHNGGETTSDSFAFTVSDGAGGTISATTFTITVKATNDAPTITSVDNQSIDEDGATAALSFTVGDAETAAASLTVSASSSNTTLVPDANIVLGGSGTSRTVTVTPAADTSGTATITLTVRDGTASTSTSFIVTVTAVNDVPTLAANTGLTVDEGSSGAITAAKLQVTDMDNTAVQITYIIGTAPANGTLYRSAVALAAAGTFTQADVDGGSISYTHNGGETTSDAFAFTVSDGAGGSIVSTTFNITVTAVNDAPTQAANTGLTVDEGSSGTVTAAKLQVTDVDNTPAQTTYTIGMAPANGALYKSNVALAAAGAFTQADVDAGSISYTHDGGETTSDSFTFTVSDGAGGSIASTTFNITVTAVNDAPTITMPGAPSTDEDTNLAISGISVSDADAGSANIQATFTVRNGTLIVNTEISGGVGAAGVTGNSTATVTVTGALTQINNTLAGTNGLVYRGALNFNGNDTLTVTANDLGNSGIGGDQTATETVGITVAPVNDAPILSFIYDRSNAEGETITIWAAIGGDVDGDRLIYSATGLPPGISINVGTGELSGTLSYDVAGEHAATITVTDPGFLTATRTFTWMVYNTNRAPSLAPIDSPSSAAGTEVSLSVDGTDADGDRLHCSAAGLPPGLSINNVTGAITGTLSDTATGTYDVTVTVADPYGARADQSFIWSVYAAHGSGRLTVSPDVFFAGQAGIGLTFTYTAAAGGTKGGALEITVPNGWTAPGTSPYAPGYTSADTGRVTVSGRTITVSGLALTAGGTLTVRYSKATAGKAAGTHRFEAAQQSLADGVSVSLDAAPAVEVVSPLHGINIKGPVRVAAGQVADFTTVGVRADGTPAAVSPVWTATGGAMADGIWAAPTRPGVYTVSAAEGKITGSLTVTVVPGPVARVNAEGGASSVTTGEALVFIAVAFDQYGNRVPDAAIAWSATGGSVSQNGLFIAGAADGTGTVTAAVGKVSGSATVLIRPKPAVEPNDDRKASEEGTTGVTSVPGESISIPVIGGTTATPSFSGAGLPPGPPVDNATGMNMGPVSSGPGGNSAASASISVAESNTPRVPAIGADQGFAGEGTVTVALESFRGNDVTTVPLMTAISSGPFPAGPIAGPFAASGVAGRDDDRVRQDEMDGAEAPLAVETASGVLSQAAQGAVGGVTTVTIVCSLMMLMFKED